MNFKLFALVIFLTFFAQSCLIPSIHSLYSEEFAIQNDALIGKWVNHEDPDHGDYQEWTFEKDGDKYYLTHADGNLGFFEIGLVKLGDDMFMDFFPTNIDRSLEKERNGKTESLLNELLRGHLLPVHTFAKVNIRDRSIEIRMFDAEWLSDLMEERKIRIKHERIDKDMFLITASTSELQKFVRKYADLKEAYIDYDDPLVLTPKDE